MKKADLETIKVYVEVIDRNLGILMERVKKTHGTQFEPNITDTKKVIAKLKTIKKKSAELTTMF